MIYSIYKNISEKDLKILKKDFDSFKPILSDYMIKQGFKIEPKPDTYEAETIGVGFLKSESSFRGGVGIKYDDLKDQQTFTLHIIKTLDEDKRRYFRKNIIKQFFTLDELKINYKIWMSMAIEHYNSLNKSDLNEYFDQVED